MPQSTHTRTRDHAIGVLGSSIFVDAGKTKKVGHSFLVTLVNSRTDDEKQVWINASTDNFMTVLDLIMQIKAREHLQGYEIFEALEVANYVQGEF